MKTRRPEPAHSQPLGSSSRLVLGHSFRDPALLDWALTHRSLSYERSPEESARPSGDNEQLEFVGDAVLGLVVAEALFRRFPGSREGELTRLRASLVSRKHLADVAIQMDLGDLLLLGRGEEQSGGRRKPALLSNALEAVIAALYLDGGLEVARSFIDRVVIAPFLPELQDALASGGKFTGAIGDHKSALQEYMQSSGAGQPHYVLTAQSGPDHRKTFRVEVRIPEANGASRPIGESEGTSKKQAQQQAARIALENLVNGDSGPLTVPHPRPGGLMQTSPVTTAVSNADGAPPRPSSAPPAPGSTRQPPHLPPDPPLKPSFFQLHDGTHTLSAIQSLSCIIVIAIFTVTFSLQPFRIPSASMEPTLLVGDFLLVDKFIDQQPSTSASPLNPFPASTIHRGDVIVFYYPVDPSLHLVKRVIGLPGDRLRMRAGRVYLNGHPSTSHTPSTTRSHEDPFRDNFPHLQSTDPDVSSRWWIEMQHLVDRGELSIPPGQYFVLGDNRNDSEDSRYWGLVPSAAIVGEPFLVYFSLRNSTDDALLAHDRSSGTTTGSPHRSLAEAILDSARWHRVFHVIH